MVEVTERTIEGIEALRRTNLESQIIQAIAERLGVSGEEALHRYYAHPLAAAIERNDYGLQYLDAAYLADEVLGDRHRSALASDIG